MYEINLPEIYIADALGIFLMLNVLFSGSWKLQKKRKEDKILLGMIITIFISCIADVVTFTVDGLPGTLFRNVAYASNFVLFLGNLFIGPLWLMMILKHIGGRIPKGQQIFTAVVSGFGFLLLLLNFVYPILFCLDDANRYSRGSLFWINNLIEALFMLDSVAYYLLMRFQNGGLKFFPVMQFLLPVFVCVAVQNAWYGISTIWVGIAVGVTGMNLALQNENIFIDKLTGLFNRYYLDKVVEEMGKRRGFVMMMLDLNDFKLINDTYGHSRGDEALAAMAEILRDSMGTCGTAIRYAGDEFVILVNSDLPGIAERYEKRIRKNVDLYNERSLKKYALSVSIGSGYFNLKDNSVDDILEIIDKRMYDDKRSFYESGHLPDRRRQG